jgi:hypothetical protein
VPFFVLKEKELMRQSCNLKRITDVANEVDSTTNTRITKFIDLVNNFI